MEKSIFSKGTKMEKSSALMEFLDQWKILFSAWVQKWKNLVRRWNFHISMGNSIFSMGTKMKKSTVPICHAIQ